MAELRRICITCQRLYGCKSFSGEFQPVITKDCDGCTTQTLCPPRNRDMETHGICSQCKADLDSRRPSR